MDTVHFDRLSKLLARPLSTRQLLLGVLGGAASTWLAPTMRVAGKRGGGKKGKKKTKRCKNLAIYCQLAAEKTCEEQHPNDETLRYLCEAGLIPCCDLYHQCKIGEGDACTAAWDPLPCCENAADICCHANGSGIACCPPNFPHCPDSGAVDVGCCPAIAPHACANGSCRPDNYQCCDNNTGSCPTTKVCCPNDRCCTGSCDECPPQTVSTAARESGVAARDGFVGLRSHRGTAGAS